MTTRYSLCRAAYREVRKPLALIMLLLLSALLSILYPSKLETYPILANGSAVPRVATLTERYVRFVPTIVQIALPIALCDKVGVVQLLYVGISTTILTQGSKHLLHARWIGLARLDRRPNGGGMNMPSGHSSMASCAAYYIGRRYGLWLGILLAVIVGLTMYARVMLNAHTISAVIAGALIGCLTAACFTSPRTPSSRQRPEARQPARA